MSTAQRSEEESARYTRRLALKTLNVFQPATGTVVCRSILPSISHPVWYGGTGLILVPSTGSSKSLDSSLKRHTAFIKKIRQSVGAENRDQLLKDIETLSLGKHVDELDSAVLEGILRCKSEKDVWSAVEVRHTIPLTVCGPSHGENGGCWFVDNQRDSSSFPDVIYTECRGFVIYGAGCAVSCLSC